MGGKTNLSNLQYQPLLFPFPELPSTVFCIKEPREVSITEFYTVSDGKKKIYTLNDCIKHAGEQKIKSTTEVSFMNLFVNGVLQPKVNYEVEEERIILKTIDAPIKDSPIILQMIAF
ncbi:DUF4183 domain-containing protein [Viridibacillus sp. YIM B01967]|uniref:DUF4183 domain-containing protein n=1 Tax=Viridibacillus soli TaxID=2798301 RepID=A0ABS1H4Z9_9BACL|nr:DUF4183 domain-containing protein [Viridibacillus soli]MBK3494479.1 DUF4183 domain-containing protein [Viridibacillus soli]